jgi:hypothetical protein
MLTLRVKTHVGVRRAFLFDAQARSLMFCWGWKFPIILNDKRKRFSITINTNPNCTAQVEPV